MICSCGRLIALFSGDKDEQNRADEDAERSKHFDEEACSGSREYQSHTGENTGTKPGPKHDSESGDSSAIQV